MELFNLDPNDFVLGLHTLITGLAITKILTYFGTCLHLRHVRKQSLFCYTWLLLLFVLLAQSWFLLAGWREDISLNFFELLGLIATPCLIYLMVDLLTPDHGDSGEKAEAIFRKNRVLFMSLALAALTLESITAIFVYYDPSRPKDIVFSNFGRYIGCLPIIVGLMTSDMKAQKWVLALIWLATLISLKITTL